MEMEGKEENKWKFCIGMGFFLWMCTKYNRTVCTNVEHNKNHSWNSMKTCWFFFRGVAFSTVKLQRTIDWMRVLVYCCAMNVSMFEITRHVMWCDVSCRVHVHTIICIKHIFFFHLMYVLRARIKANMIYYSDFLRSQNGTRFFCSVCSYRFNSLLHSSTLRSLEWCIASHRIT